ncbi:hypothetical protein R7Q48_22765 [Vibrio sp. 378]|nr:hypothetical protein [Vibrio sp. 378]
MEDSVVLYCTECKGKHEWVVVATNPAIDEKTAERVWECTNCGNEETETLR